MAVNKKTKKVQWVCFVAYLLFLSYALFFSSAFGRTDHGEYRYNLTLFQEIGRFYHYGMNTASWRLFIMNVVGNIAVFIPMGIFLPVVTKRCKNVFFTVLFSFEISLLAEIIQLVTKVGSFDVDDLLLNTLGGLCGYVFWRLWMRFRGAGKSKAE